MGGGRADSPDILDNHQLRSQDADCLGHVRPDPAAGTGTQPGPQARAGDILAGETAGEDVHRLDGGPVRDGDVAEVGHIRVTLLEQQGHIRIAVGDPGQLGTGKGDDGGVQAAVPGARAAEFHRGRTAISLW